MKKSKIVVIILSIIIFLLSVYSVIATKAVADSITDYNELYDEYQALSKKYSKYESEKTSYTKVVPPSTPKTSENKVSSRDVDDLSIGESIVLLIVLSPFVMFVMMCSSNTKKKRRRKMCGPGGY